MNGTHRHEMNSGLSSLLQALEVLNSDIVEEKVKKEMLSLALKKVQTLVELWDAIKRENA